MQHSIPPTEPHGQENLAIRLLDKLANARFFAVSALLHLALVALLGVLIITRYVEPLSDFQSMPGTASTDIPIGPVVDVGIPNSPPAPPATDPASSSASTSASDQLTVLVMTDITKNFQKFPRATPPTVNKTRDDFVYACPLPADPSSSHPPSLSENQLRAIKAFQSGNHNTGPSGGPPGEGAFTFKAYVAKYTGGDWNSAHVTDSDSNKIERGALPNLLYVISKLSKDKIKGDAYATPLDLASEEIFNVKPAFIMMTGTRDFTLSDNEINNLRRYILLGGAIWGDSTLPGRGSRFDIAFRREMRRVIADKDKEFEALPADHPLYTSMIYRDIKSAPAGLNYYQEPVYVLKIFDETAIIYTSNSYSGMWQVGLDEKGRIDTRRDERKQHVAINDNYYGNRDIYFRNLDEPALSQSYKFGTNMVLYLLTRWEDKIRKAH